MAQSSKQNEDWAIFIYIQQIYIETIVIFQIFVYL